MPPTAQRLSFIDVARTYAVISVLLAHALNATGTFARMGTDSFSIHQFTRMATPMFVFIFGFMIEYVYVWKAQQQGLVSVRSRLMTRSLQCYGAYALTSFSALVAGYKTNTEFLSSLFFFSDSRFGNILRVYAVILLAAPWLIRLRLKYGPIFLFFALIFVLLSSSILIEAKKYSFGPLDIPLNVFFGIGPCKGGPSIWHSLSLLLAGMLVATSLRNSCNNQLSTFYFTSSLIIVTSLLLGLLLIDDNPFSAWKKFVDFTYRGSNAGGFYIIGIIGSTAIMMLLGMLIGTRAVPFPLTCLLPFGHSSLFAYTFGNVLLNLIGSMASKIPLLIFLPLFFALVLLCTVLARRVHFGTRLSAQAIRCGQG